MSNDKQERDRRFRDLLVQLTKSPLYKQKLAEYNTMNVGLEQIPTLPLTSKAELRKAGAFGHLSVDRRELVQYHESFGTTGEPVNSWFTKEDLETGGRQIRECGVRLNTEDVVLIRFPYGLSVLAFLMQQACLQAGSTIVPVSGLNAITPYPKVLELMNRLGVTVIAGLPREIELLAETAHLLGSDTSEHFPALRVICVTGELLGDRRREHIERQWGVPVFDIYSSSETANIATMCGHGMMHVVEQDFVVEVLKEDGSGPALPGERGLAAITTLSHQASPLLRYLNEDVISVEQGLCTCGRNESKLVHYGRIKDRTRFGKVVLDDKDVQDAIYSLSPVPVAWKAIQQENGFHIILDSQRSAEWPIEGIQTQLAGLLKVPVTVEIAIGTLLNRDELTHNAPSKKTVYISKHITDDPEASNVILMRDLLDRGFRMFKNDKYEQSRELFEQAALLDPCSAEAHAWLAAVYGRQIDAVWDMVEKIKLLSLLESEIAAALELDPTLPLARRMNGARLLNTPDMLGGDPAAAADEFRYCVERGMDEAEVWVSLAECYIKTDEPAKAIDALEEALAREPQNERAAELIQHVRSGSAEN